MSVHVTSGRWRLGITLSLITAFLWAVAPIALKVVLGGMDAYTITLYRFLIATAILGFFVFRKHGKPSLEKLRGATPWLLLIAVAGLCGNQLLFLIGLDHMTPSATVVVIQMAPIFLLAGGIVLFKERYAPYQFLGLAILIIGLILFFNQRLYEIFSGFGKYTIGILLVLASAFLWSVYALSQKQLLKVFPSETIMLVIYVGVMLSFLPASSPLQALELDSVSIALLIFCGLNTVCGYGCFSEALDHLEASRVSTVLATIPLMNIGLMKIIETLAPGFIETEPMNFFSLIGALLVVSGSMLSSLSGTPR